MTTPRMLNIAYLDNQLVQRYIGSRQVQGKELVFGMSDGVARRGFVTGLDDDSVQVCSTGTLKSSLLFIPHIIEVGETGQTFDSLSPADAEAIKKFTKIFRRVAENELSTQVGES